MCERVNSKCVVYCVTGSRTVRQLLPPIHQLSQGQDAYRPGHRREGVVQAADGPVRLHQRQRRTE